MSGKRSRDKGARFERFLVGVLKVVFPDVHRGQQSHNPRHCDVEGTPFRIEAKHWARLTYQNILDALEQAEENGQRFDDDRVPVAISKRDGEDPVVHTHLRYFLQMIEKHFYAPPELADVIPINGENE